ncbi:MAG: hypothetical protein Q9220_006979 [cf. Caloplaca sp. 1 TL-2023]
MGSNNSDIPLFSEYHGPDIPEPTQTLYQILTESVHKYPERTALVSCHQGSNLFPPCLGLTQDQEENRPLRLSYAQLENVSGVLASYLARHGISKGDALVVVVHTCAEWVLLFWAAVKLNCPFVPINPAIVSRANEIKHSLGALERIGALVAADESIVKLLLGNAPIEVHGAGTKLILGKVGVIGWTPFDDAFATPDKNPRMREAKQNMKDTVLVVLTSGTTALPKGCPHSNKTVASACARHKIMYSLDETRISCNHMPLFHLAGIMECLWAWAYGGTVVFPNQSFDARATLDAIDKERCTDMCLVPSMLRAMVDHPILPNRDTDSLQLIKLAANDVMGSDARSCSEVFHAKVVTNAFGMTETGCMTDIYAWRDGICKDTEPFPVGRMAPGAKARICAPDSRKPVKRGVIGELHQGGGTITDRYIGGGGSSFYTDKRGSWHVSGDRAIMADTGEITVLGRYKDIINRAGENISPVVMERVLNEIEGVQSCQVVGVPDEVAGEVPVAVIKMAKNGTVAKGLLYDRVVKELGVTFALERVMDLKELAVDDWPMTATGKVRKVDVRQLVLDHLDFESQRSTHPLAHASTEAALTRIWARFSGVPEDQISPTMSLEGMVDSVTVMRFRSQVKKELGKTLSLEELNGNPTIVKQAAILDSQQESLLQGSEAAIQPVREGPPGLQDVVHTRGKQTMFNEIRKEAEKKLHAMGLSWNKDVEEVLPIYDFLQSWRVNIDIIFRIGFLSTKATTKELRSALEAVLSQHGMLRTILVETASVGQSWAMIRPSKTLFNLMIKDGGTLRTPEDLLSLDLSYRDENGSIDSKPLPLFYITICFIEATQSAGFVVYGDHSTYDAHSVLLLFVEDLMKALKDPGTPIPARPKYSLFANAYHNYRTSIPAQISLDHYTAYIKGIAQRKGGAWPQQTFKSINAPWNRTADHLLLKGDITPGLTGIAKHIKIDMSTNQYLKVHKIPHLIAIKAAIAIYNTQQTSHPYAFFSSLQMARSYPFLPSQITSYLPDIMDMPGATIEAPMENIHLPPDEPLSSFLQRMHSDQNEQTIHAQCPILRFGDVLDPEDAQFLSSLFGRQAVNYNPVVTPDPNALLQNIQFAGHANLSIMWWCGMVDAETVQMRITWNDSVLQRADAERAMEGFERNMKWIVDGGNWERKVGECTA